MWNLNTEVATMSDTPPRIAIVSGSECQRINLGLILGKNGLQVVFNQPPSRESLALARAHKAEVLLIDLDDEASFDPELLLSLLEQDSLPMLLNDSAATRMSAGILGGDWGRSLARKLAALATEARVRQEETAVRAAPRQSDVSVSLPTSMAVPGATHVWVLGASIGGPQALKQFLGALAPDLPLAFVLAQHIGTNFIALLARQLDQISSYHILTAQAGEVLGRQQVVLAPVDEDMNIDAAGRIQCTPVADNRALYRPSIDTVLTNIAQRYGSNSGAIIFSGMGNDGAEGVRAIAAQGGQVWAQDYASCLVSSMPDQARMTKVVSFSGTPEALARKLSQRYTTPGSTHQLQTQEERTA
jgi:chemosensory pili system protein ChpB (putative protein-glutamate methylesterase)